MGRIRGHYEWDDEDLSPGHKKEGGLHQNLFDSEGHLKGSARFIPDPEGTSGPPLVVTETVYVLVEQRRKSAEQEVLEQAIAELLSLYLDQVLAKIEAWAARRWRETVRPAISARLARVRERHKHRKMRKGAAVVQETMEVAEAPDDTRPHMSSAEAQARILAAIAARAYSDEQMRLVVNAKIVDSQGRVELERALAALPSAQVTALVEAMATNPSLLGDDTLAELASLLGRRALP